MGGRRDLYIRWCRILPGARLVPDRLRKVARASRKYCAESSGPHFCSRGWIEGESVPRPFAELKILTAFRHLPLHSSLAQRPVNQIISNPRGTNPSKWPRSTPVRSHQQRQRDTASIGTAEELTMAPSCRPPLLPPQVAQGALRGPLQRSSQHHERPSQQGAP